MILIVFVIAVFTIVVMKTSLFPASLLTLIVPALAHAQIYNCNGVVTNKPCENGVPVMEEKAYQDPDPKVVAEARRSLWLENLDLARGRVSREFGVSIDITSTRDQCMTSSLDECRRVINEKEKDINQLIIVAKNKTESNKSSTSTDKNSANQTVVTIINDRNDDLILGRRRPWNQDRFPPHRPGTNPPYSTDYNQPEAAPRPVFNPQTGQVYDPGVAPGMPGDTVPELSPPLRR